MTWKRTCIWKRDSMEFRNATSARLVMLMQTSHNDALKWKWKWNWNCKRLVTHLRPTKGSCANFLDPLSRRCAKLNRCQPTSLSFTLHQKFHWNFKRNKSEWESRHHLDLIPVEICHMQDLKNICDITIGTCTCCLVCTLHATTTCAENEKASPFCHSVLV